jgi:hypothetical protein
MSDYDYAPAAQQFADDEWEEALTHWVKQADPRALSLWLLRGLCHIAPPASTQLLDEMQRWYAQPEEKLRWQIFHHAEILGFDTPAGALALSLFWSQGSMSPEGLEPVYPEQHLSGEMRRCVLLMMATRNIDNPADGTRRLLAQWTQEKA